MNSNRFNISRWPLLRQECRFCFYYCCYSCCYCCLCCYCFSGRGGGGDNSSDGVMTTYFCLFSLFSVALVSFLLSAVNSFYIAKHRVFWGTIFRIFHAGVLCTLLTSTTDFSICFFFTFSLFLFISLHFPFPSSFPPCFPKRKVLFFKFTVGTNIRY